jgi:hypothetical protein
MSGAIRRFIFACAFVAALPSGCAGQSGHDITVRILDAGSGKPLTHIWAGLEVLEGTNKARRLSDARTDSRGIAIFHLADPLPERIGLLFGAHEFGNCSEVQFLTDHVVNGGVVGRNYCVRPGIGYSMSPRPGELVIFGRRITLWDNIRREIP